MEVLLRMMMMMATRGWWRWTPPSLSDQHWSGLGALMLSQKQEEKQDKPVIPPTLSTYGAFFVRLKITVHCFMCKSTALLLISLLLLIAVCRGLIIGADLSPKMFDDVRMRETVAFFSATPISAQQFNNISIHP